MKCEKCNTEMEIDKSIVFTSNPPMYKAVCPNCKNTSYVGCAQAYAGWEPVESVVESKPYDRNIGPHPTSGDTVRKRGTTKPLYLLCGKTDIGFRFVQCSESIVSGGELWTRDLYDNYELVERPKPIEETISDFLKPIEDYIEKDKVTKWVEDFKNLSKEEKIKALELMLEESKKIFK